MSYEDRLGLIRDVSAILLKYGLNVEAFQLMNRMMYVEIHENPTARWGRILAEIKTVILPIPSAAPSPAGGAHQAPRIELRNPHSRSGYPEAPWLPPIRFNAVPNKAYVSKMSYPPLRFVRFSGPTLTEGIETGVVDGVSVRRTSVARTVTDCFKYHNKIGQYIALEVCGHLPRDQCRPTLSGEPLMSARNLAACMHARLFTLAKETGQGLPSC